MKFCLLFNLSPCARYCLLIGSQLTTWSQGNLHYIRLHFFQLDREFFCLLPSLARLYSAAASPSERFRSDGSLAMNQTVKYQGAFSRIVGFCGQAFLLFSPTPPTSIFFFFCSCSNFRAITRLETPATQARRIVAGKGQPAELFGYI